MGCRGLLTLVALHGIDIHRGVEFPRPKEAGAAEQVARAVRWCPVRAEQATRTVRVALLILCTLLHLYLLLLGSVHIMDAHQQAVVHYLQLRQELWWGQVTREVTGHSGNMDPSHPAGRDTVGRPTHGVPPWGGRGQGYRTAAQRGHNNWGLLGSSTKAGVLPHGGE